MISAPAESSLPARMRGGAAHGTAPLVALPGSISGASQRLRALSALSGSLTDALDPEEAARLVETQALSALGATSAVVVTLGPFPPPPTGADVEDVDRVLRLVHAIGLPAEVRALVDRLPLAALVPLAEVARDGVPLFLASEPELLRYPAWGAAMLGAGARAAAIVPVWANGELRGVLGLAWAEPRDFDEDERAFVLTLGVMCAQAIMRAHLRAAEKAASKAAVDARELAEVANRSKADFLATISHELRTPMNAVLGYTQLLADEMFGPVTPLQRDQLQRMSVSGNHLLGLIKQLLNHARIEAGGDTVERVSIALAELLEQSLVLIRPLAQQKGLRVTVDGPAEPVELHTDPGKVRQILVNVLANAVKFSDRGDITLLARVDVSAQEKRVVIEVCDRGMGIAPEHHERVFEPFWQSNRTALGGPEGTGLGLAVARQLARLLGGDVRLEASSPGLGSTFVLSLPLRVGAAT